MRNCRKQKIGRAVLYYPDDGPSFEPEHLCAAQAAEDDDHRFVLVAL